jgi:WD40 repeat protein
MRTGSLVRAIDKVQVDRITAMAVTRDGRWIATGTSTGEISRSYNILTKRRTVFDNRDPVRIWDARSGAMIEQLPVKNEVEALAFAPDRHYLFEVEAKSPGQELLNVWSLATHSLVQSQPTPREDREILALAMSPNGKRLAAVGTGIAVYRYAH